MKVCATVLATLHCSDLSIPRIECSFKEGGQTPSTSCAVAWHDQSELSVLAVDDDSKISGIIR